MKSPLLSFRSIAIFIFCLIFFNSFAFSTSDFPPLKYASADYNPQTGLIYQGLSDKEHIYLNTEELPIQGKQKGSLNLIDFDNDGKGDIFTTGYYTNNEGEEIATTELHKDLITKTGNFSQLKHSASCWADFDNNGFMEPAITGQDNDDKSYFEIYRNNKGIIRNAHSLPGFKYGSLECFDFNKDGWTDLVACGQDAGGNFYAGIYQNHEGLLEQTQTLQELAFCSININDFDQNGFLDFVIGGEDTNYQPYTYLYSNNGQTFTRTSIGLNQSVKIPVITSADYDNDGWPDLVLSGSAKQSKTLLLRNQGNGFGQVATDIIQVQDSTVQFMDFDQDQQLEFFITGVYSDGIDERYLSQLLSFNSTVENIPPSAPSELNYESLDQQFLKLTWQKATDDHSGYLFYHVRAGTEDNPNEFLSGFLFDEKGNAQLNNFNIITNPCLTGIDSFLFQVQAIDSAYSISEWSEPVRVECRNETRAIETTPLNETPDLDNISGYLPATPSMWSFQKDFNNLTYQAYYEHIDGNTMITEVITNQDIFAHENISIMHEITGIFKPGSYYPRLGSGLYYYLPYLKTGGRIALFFTMKDTLAPGTILPIEISSLPIVPAQSLKRDINVTTTIRNNKTIIKFEARVNESNIAERGVVIRQTLPKCLIKYIDKLTLKSGIIKSNRKFTILKEDPVIMWTFESIISPELLTLEIAAVADENCRNQIKTEIVAKKYIAQNTSVNMLRAGLQFLVILMLLLGFCFLLAKVHRLAGQGRSSHIILLTISAFLIILSIIDTFLLLPPALDFLKKLASWTAMLLFIIHIDLSRLVAGKSENQKERMYRRIFNSCLITGFTFLSIKNIVYAALETYGNDKFFSDMLILIIRNAKWLETYLFFTGIILLTAAILIATLRLSMTDNSMAELIGTKKQVSVKTRRIRKFLFDILLIIGFYAAIFSFLFDWFSIGVDSPFLLLVVFFSWHGLAKVSGQSEASLKSYIKMFTHKANRRIAMASFAVIIFMVEGYMSVFYMLTSRRNLYLHAIEQKMPTLAYIILHQPWQVWIVYIIQVMGLIAAMVLIFSYWWHSYLRQEKEKLQSLYQRPHYNTLFYLVIIGTVSFALNPVFRFSSLTHSRLSGVILILQEHLLKTDLTLHYVILGIVSAFFCCFFLLRRIKRIEVIPYLCSLVPVFYFTILFLKSYLVQISTYLQNLFSWGNGNISLVAATNSLFLVIMAGIYCFIIVYSLYALIRKMISYCF